MKIVLVTIIMAASICIVNAQDRIIKLSGDTVSCTVSEINQHNIKFKYPDEDLVNIISTNIVQEIYFNSGRVQKFNARILVLSAADWGKVIITKNASDVEGLKRIGEVSAKASSGAPVDQAKIQKKAMDKLRKKAASLKGHIVLILTESGDPGGWGPSGGSTKASYIGIVYGY